MTTVKINNMILTPLHRALCEPVLKALYNRINIMNYRYQMMTDKSHIQEVVNADDKRVCIHIQGFNYLMFFTMVDGKQYNCLVSKKELKYFFNQNRLNEVRIYTFRARHLPESYYHDTIFDGKIIKVEAGNAGVYMVYDAYYLCGQNVQSIDIDKKMLLVRKMLDDLNTCCTVKIEAVNLYGYENIPALVYENAESTHKVNGLVFLPRMSGKWYIYVNDSEFEGIRNGTDSEECPDPKPTTNESQQEFVVKKTDIPDVYELYWDLTTRGLVREGIAYIPNMHTSHYCRRLFKDKEMQKMTCVKSVKFNKWIPLCQDITELSSVIF